MNLKEIEIRAKHLGNYLHDNRMSAAEMVSKDVPALIAQIRGQRNLLKKLRNGIGDHYHPEEITTDEDRYIYVELSSLQTWWEDANDALADLEDTDDPDTD